MFLNNEKITKITTLVKKHFLLHFCISIFFIATLIYLIKLNVFFLNPFYFVYIAFLSGSVAFFLLFNKLIANNKIKIIILNILANAFLSATLFITTLNFSKKNLELPEGFFTFTVYFCIFISFILFYSNRNIIGHTIGSSVTIYDKTKINTLFEKYKKYIYYLVLLTIIIASTLIKLPYFNYTFTGEHSQKYNGYVEPALVMLKNHTSLPNTKLFESDPLNNFYGNYDSIGGNIPFTEWIVYISNKYLPNSILSIEFKTRLAMNFIGSLLLVASYFFCKSINNEKVALVFVSLIALLPTYQLITYLTIADTIMFVFLTLSLIQIFKYLKTNSEQSLFLAFVLGGISITCKDTAIIILAPFFVYSFLKHRDLKKIIISSIVGGFVLISSKIFYFITLYNLPKNIPFFIFLTLLPIYFYFYGYKVYPKLLNFNFKINKKMLYTGIAAAFIILVIIINLASKRANNFIGGFITSQDLLNINFFTYLINKKIIIFYSNTFFILGMTCYIFSLYIKQARLTINLLLISSLCFLLLASKVIFFHNYYTFYFGYILCYFIAIVLFSFSKTIFPKVYILLIVLILANIYNQVNPITTKLLTRQKNGVLAASEYLKQKMNSDELFMYNREAHVLTIYSLVNSFDFRKLNQPTFKDQIEKNGINDTFKKYKIKYYITTNPDPKFEELVAIFSKDLEDETEESLRSQIIFKEINKTPSIFKDIVKREQEITRFGLREHFFLERQFDDYYIYSIN